MRRDHHTPTSTEIQALVQLGFTELEAGVYAFLLTESPATGYRVAQAMGKPFAGVYKSLEGLEAKGAVMLSDEEGTRLARAVAPEELVSRLEAGYRRECAAARKLLKQRAPGERDERVYRIDQADQFIQRTLTSIESARSVIVGTVCPRPLSLIADALESAIARGVRVGIKVFEHASIPGMDEYLDLRGLEALSHGPGQWLSLSIDGRENLEALFSHDSDDLHYAFWTENPLLGWSHYSGRGSDLVVAAIQQELIRAFGPGPGPRLGGAERATGAWQSNEALRIVASVFERLAPFERPDTEGKLYLKQKFRSGSGPRRKEQER
jgi:sugar-specific transcriptional regulator TrmB